MITNIVHCLKSVLVASAAVLAVTMWGCSVADTVSLGVQQPAAPPTMASMRPAAPRLAVEPPEFSDFDRALTNEVNSFLKRAPYAALQRQRDELAQKEGRKPVSVRQYCYTTDRSLEEVVAYFRKVLELEAEVPLVAEPLIPPLEQWAQLSQLAGVPWEDGFLDQVAEAYTRYPDETAQTAQFPPAEGPDEGATTSFKVFRPFVSPATWEKTDRTVIIFSVTRQPVTNRP